VAYEKDADADADADGDGDEHEDEDSVSRAQDVGYRLFFGASFVKYV
jgi:hypothetical protein